MIDHLRRERQNGNTQFLTLSLRNVVLSVGVVRSEFAAGEDFKGLGTEAQFFENMGGSKPGGEGGIRTPGTGLTVQRFSKPPP